MTHAQKVVTEDTIKKIFSTFGEVKDVVIKKLVVNQKANTLTGYGFIHYPLSSNGITAAKMAAWKMKENTVDNIIFRCSISHGLQQLIQQESTISPRSANLIESRQAYHTSNHSTHTSMASSLTSSIGGQFDNFSHGTTNSSTSPISMSPNSSSSPSPINSPVLKPSSNWDLFASSPSHNNNNNHHSNSFYQASLLDKSEGFLPISIDTSGHHSNSFYENSNTSFFLGSPSLSSKPTYPGSPLNIQSPSYANNAFTNNNWLSAKEPASLLTHDSLSSEVALSLFN